MPYIAAVLIAVLSLVTAPTAPARVAPAASVAQAQDAIDGFGPWKFGMSREEVAAFEEFGPFEPVQSTGGLETYNADFDGRPTNVSFVFDEAGLQLVQIWAYEGPDFEEAAAGLHRVYEHIIANFGEMMMAGGKLEAGLDVDALIERIPEPFHGDVTPLTLEDIQARGGSMQVSRPIVLRLEPVWQPQGGRILATLRRSEDIGSFWVFLFYIRP